MRPLHMRRRAGALALLLLVSMACGGESEREASDRRLTIAPLRGPDLIPKELLEALLANRVGPDRQGAELLPGKLPSSAPFDVPPPEGARVVGSLARGSSGTIVFAVPQTALDAVRAYESVLKRSDWRAPGGRPGGGFRTPDLVHASYCRGENRSLGISGVDRRDGGAFLRVSYAEDQRTSHCGGAERRGMLSPRGPIPALYPPRDITVLDGTMGGSSGHTEAHARLRTRLSSHQLVGHYGPQVRAEGWSLQSESASADLSAQTWRLEDGEGQVWIGLLLAHSIPGTEDRAVMFRVTSREFRRP